MATWSATRAWSRCSSKSWCWLSAVMYLLNSLRSARMALYFWLCTKLSSMTRMAASASMSSTWSLNRMRACASAMRMMLSMWRTAIGMPL